MIPVYAVIAFGLLMFGVGVAGVLLRKNLIVVLMALELLLNGANVLLIGFGLRLKSPVGSIFALFVIMMAVAEAAVGFALMLNYFRHRESYDLDEMTDLKG
jgi:NADH-quinone oxidoreductase subunit K